MGIEENNVPSPNTGMVELKSSRKQTSSMLTLFTNSPYPRRKAIQDLLREFGYASPSEGRILHATLRAGAYTSIKTKRLKIEVGDKVEIVSPEGEVLGYWDMETLKTSFERKIHELLYVKADCRGQGSSEEFWFNEAWLLKGFSFEGFKELVRNDVVYVDLRIGQYPDGSEHDHGTGFRIRLDKLDLAFEEREKIM